MVWLEPDPASDIKLLPVFPGMAKLREETVFLEIQICRFQPHMMALREGQLLKVRNHDPVPHAVQWDANLVVNHPGAMLVPAGEVIKISLKSQPLPVIMKCPIHPWMRSWVWVFSHPYFAITGPDGRFEIPHAPVGIWRLRVWHEETGWRGGKAGKYGQAIHLLPGKPTDLGDLVLNP
ncbi:MAG: hypothetical protein EXR99_05650 [Gemmataceae bacterium]|nr:hypothetical protein [Gemmataceae bacterium]